VGCWCGCLLSRLDSVLPQTLELACPYVSSWVIHCALPQTLWSKLVGDKFTQLGLPKAEEKNRIYTNEIALCKRIALWILSVYLYHLFNPLYHLTDFCNIYVVLVHSSLALFTSLQHVAKAWWTCKCITWEQYWYLLMQNHKIMCGDRFLKNMQLFVRSLLVKYKNIGPVKTFIPLSFVQHKLMDHSLKIEVWTLVWR
jgi:hypothetical protein